jgi:hypothetical protein
MSRIVRFNFRHFLPYVRLPETHKESRSIWVNFSNRHYSASAGRPAGRMGEMMGTKLRGGTANVRVAAE